MTMHPQDESTLDTIGFASRLGVLIILVIIACIRFGYGG